MQHGAKAVYDFVKAESATLNTAINSQKTNLNNTNTNVINLTTKVNTLESNTNKNLATKVDNDRIKVITGETTGLPFQSRRGVMPPALPLAWKT